MRRMRFAVLRCLSAILPGCRVRPASRVSPSAASAKLVASMDSAVSDHAQTGMTMRDPWIGPEFDSAMVTSLDAGWDVGRINASLSRLPGYGGLGGHGRVVTGAGFPVPRDAPCCFVTQLGAGM